MGCLKLTDRENVDRPNFLSVWRKNAASESCDNYYAFGLTFNSYQRENSLKNKYLYNAGSEFQDDLGVDVSETELRMLDSKIGRWWQTDPKSDHGGQESLTSYQYAFNNPVLHNDPKGDCPPGVNCAALIAAASADATAHPNGVGAHALGIGQGLQNSVTGLFNAVAHPIQTLQGLGNLALGGLAQGNPAAMMQMDHTLGTNSFGAMAGLSNAITSGANNLIHGNGIQRGTVIGEIGGSILGSKGLSAGFGALRSTLGAVNFGQKLFLSENFGITSTRFGNSGINGVSGTLNQSGSALKIGWSGTTANGGGQVFRIGIGSIGNKSPFHIDLPKTFLPNNFVGPSMQVKQSIFNAGKYTYGIGVK